MRNPSIDFNVMILIWIIVFLSGCKKNVDLTLTDEVATSHVAEFTGLKLNASQKHNVGIETTRAKKLPYTPTTAVYGRVIPNSNATFEISAPSAGQIAIENGRWPMPGQSVMKGQKLASLKVRVSPDLRAELQNRIAEAQSRLKSDEDVVSALAKIQEGLERIAAKEILSRTELDSATANLARAKTQVALDTSIIENWKGVLASMDSVQSKTESLWQLPILSPYDGVVAVVMSNNGSFVEPGTPLLTLIDNTQQLIQLTIPTRDVEKAEQSKSGDKLNVKINRKSYDATYIGRASSIDLSSQGFQILYSLQTHSEELRPGLLVTANIPSGEMNQEVIQIPSTSVIQHKGSYFIFVAADDDSSFQRRSVQVVNVEGESTFVRSMSEQNSDLAIGVKADEQVVSSGAQMLLSRESLVASGDGD